MKERARMYLAVALVVAAFAWETVRRNVFGQRGRNGR